jgi:hypothetical protein
LSTLNLICARLSGTAMQTISDKLNTQPSAATSRTFFVNRMFVTPCLALLLI